MESHPAAVPDMRDSLVRMVASLPDPAHMAELARAVGALEGVFVRLGPPKVRICHCGVEITPDMPEHIACYPGME